MTVNFIRHGKTAGNLEKRYIGRTDEPLCEAGIRELSGTTAPDCDIVIASPMLRCIQTAAILFPNKPAVTYDELRECDFGDFEGKNHDELRNDPAYLKWLDGGGLGTFPNGENSTDFRSRCVRGFLRALKEHSDADAITFVVHGGTIMSVLEKLAVPHREFYDYMTENGRGYVIGFDGKEIKIIRRL